MGDGTADFIKKVLSVYTHAMKTIYLSLSAQVAISTFFMKSPVVHFPRLINAINRVIKRERGEKTWVYTKPPIPQSAINVRKITSKCYLYSLHVPVRNIEMTCIIPSSAV